MMIYRILPNWAPMGGITLFGRIFLRPGHDYLIPHELVHVEQQRRDGLRFYFRYAFSAKWRVRYEAEAYAVEVRAGTRSLSAAAGALSGPLYLHACTYDEALAALRLACGA